MQKQQRVVCFVLFFYKGKAVNSKFVRHFQMCQMWSCTTMVNETQSYIHRGMIIMLSGIVKHNVYLGEYFLFIYCHTWMFYIKQSLWYKMQF